MMIRNAAGEAVLGGVRLLDLAGAGGAADRSQNAQRFQTPFYVYDLDAMEAEAKALLEAFGSSPSLIAYAVKANSAGPIIRTFAALGCGAEVVSGGELRLCLACGVDPSRILLNGVAKTNDEIDQALCAGDRGILSIQMESIEEVPRILARAKALSRRARVSFRVNPGVVADTHAHVATGHDEAKFGVPKEDLKEGLDAVFAEAGLELVGLSCHVGSQLVDTGDYIASAEELLRVASDVLPAEHKLQFIDFGGGFGIDYGQGCLVKPADFIRRSLHILKASRFSDCMLAIEPGRALVGAHGLLCAQVLLSKRAGKRENERRWLMIDAGMNDLLRPALYAARHRIESLRTVPPDPQSHAPLFRVAGPVCESSDDFGEYAFETPPDFVVIRDVGAYGFTMASEYNGRPLPREVFLKDGQVAFVHQPRTAADWSTERASIGLL